MRENQKEHFWIPDEEVIRLDKKLTARPTPRNIPFKEHGLKLSQSLQSIKQVIESVSEDDSLNELDLMVFQIELPEGEKIKDKKDLFDSNGMQVKAVKNENNAIVTTNPNTANNT